MASIRKRNGSWQAQVRITGAAPVSRTFATKIEAKRWSIQAEAAVGDARSQLDYEDQQQETIGSILTRYGNEISPTKRGCPREQSIIRLVTKYPLHSVRLNDLSEGKAAYYRDTRLKVAKPATVVRELAVLSHALEIARRVWDLPVKENVFRKVHKPAVNNARTRRLEHRELEKITTAIHDRGCDYLTDIITLAIETGARGCELFGIELQHIDFCKKTVYFPITKNGSPRTIPLTPNAIEAIIRIISKNDVKTNLITQSKHQVKRNWILSVKKSGIKGLHFHDLRHEAISRFFEMGLTVPEVAMISGHRDYKMLARYTHIRPENVAKKLADIYANRHNIKSEETI
ncbi:site-specific integrase [Methylobacterium sp. E-041]|uniref:site-specific integrase n=1 Tax=Methylobacterium sp. E-041 TaxID=2836573 RepID=UPI001FB8D092|nr:site-specific integrase [Methylobacterium sp. E-041]MCJ2105920.1 site-specific integrase [Methylobacterium sp. E-041]